MRALVTGATGFVGAAVARALVKEGWEVRALVRAGSDRRNLQGLAVGLVSGELADRGSLARALLDCDALFHVAADYRLGVLQSERLYLTNVEGTRNILSAAGTAGVKRIVYTSSVATIGIPADGSPGNESTPVGLADMIGHYKRSKFLAEQVAREFAADGLPVVVVNPSAPVGPGDVRPTPTGALVLDAAAGRTPVYVDTGLNMVHVDDVAAGHLLAYHRGRLGERYILGGEDLTLREILATIAQLVGRPPPRWRVSRAALMPVAYVCDALSRISRRPLRLNVESLRMAGKRMYFSSDKAARELGYQSRPVVQAFADALQWWREQGMLSTEPRYPEDA